MTMEWHDAPESLAEYRIGDRIEMHPATACWMSGDRFGTVEEIGRRLIYARMDRSGRRIRTVPTCIGRVQERG